MGSFAVYFNSIFTIPMINKLRHFFISQKHFSVLSGVFLLYLAISIINHYTNNPLLDLLQIIGGLFFMVFGTGIGATLTIQALFKKNFDQWEFISLAILSGMLIPPAILTAEFFLLGKIYGWYPILNSTIILAASGIILYFKKTSLPNIVLPPIRIIFKHPLFIVLALGAILTLVQVLLYKALPDLDPYKWTLKYIYQFANNQLDYTERPFFGALAFIGTQLTGLSIFIFFKYVFPFFFLASFFPAWMVARTFTQTTKQWLFLLSVFISPTILSYALIPMPQTTLMLILYFFVFLLLYSSEKRDDFFLYVAGIAIFFSFFYHQSSFIIFTIWAVCVIFVKRKAIFSDKKIFILIALLVATNLSRAKIMYNFGFSWSSTIVSGILNGNNLNLAYPARYINIDLTPMGWSSMSGVIKFYAFYMGPLLGLALLSFGILFIFCKDFRLFFLKKSGFPIIIILFSFILFFSIAEIFPRFLNVSLLPDRAWIFAGVFAFVFIFIILKYAKKISPWILSIFILCLTITLSGAIYVNYLKRYLISPAQLQSAEWIEKNLPEDRIFLSYGHKTLLPFHANTPLIRISSEIYCSKDLSFFQNILDYGNLNNEQYNSLTANYNFLEDTKKAMNDNSQNYYKNDGIAAKGYANAIIEKNIILQEISNLQNILKDNFEIGITYPVSRIPVLNSPIPVSDIYRQTYVNSVRGNIYIYYSRQNPRNPYRGRPYGMETWGIDPCPDGKFLFDLYPNKFKRIYSINNEEVIIWQVL